ncbi:MAG: CysB family HTH-type transcriptional regulator [Betaproteobacteria bacterium]
MNLHQFKFVHEAAKRGLNLTEAAKALHTSQPGVSKAILELELELGVDIFARHGKRLKSITQPGRHVLKSIDVILNELHNLKRIGNEYSAKDSGTFSIATTHTQARYVLPQVLTDLRKAYPHVNISLHQGTPSQAAHMVMNEEADVAIATESLADYEDLVTLACYDWQHVLVMPPGHPLSMKKKPIALKDLSAYPLVTYHPSFTGRQKIDQAFQVQGLSPNIALEAIDSDVIKTYVRIGMGVGIIAEMAVQPQFDSDLVIRPASHIFGKNVARVAFRRGAYLRQFVLEFAQLLSPMLSEKSILEAMKKMKP